jgi:hypothetical protein
LAELEQICKNRQKQLQIEVDQAVSEYKMQCCEKMAKEQQKVIVDSSDFDCLKTSNESLKRKYSELEESHKDEVAKKVKVAVNSATSTIELKHQAQMAEMKAENTQLKREVQALTQQITKMTQEIDKQRELTLKVAEAQKVNQTFGKEYSQK